MSGGGGTTTSNTSSTVPPDVLAEYNNVTAQANQVASTPLQQYQGQVVAGLTPAENAAFGTVNNLQSMTGPVTQSDIQGYESPYTNDVLNTTMAAENNQDAQQQEQLKGNAISAGAWGGDRSGVAQGILGGQQAYANNATNAGILNQGYSQALNEANLQQQTVFNNTLSGANAQLTAGQLQQQQAQNILNVPYEQFLQQQSYPFQTTGWLGNIAEGIGSNEGGSSTSSTTQPSQGLFGLKRGGIVPHRAAGGDTKSPSGTAPFAWSKWNPDTSQWDNRLTMANSDVKPQGWQAPQTTVLPVSSAPTVAAAPSTGSGGFTAQIAPPQSGNITSGTPYNGGIIPGVSAANQAELDSIYSGKLARGGIVSQHFDAGGGDDIMSGLYNTESANDPYAVSSAGAQGIAQIMPDTARNPGFGVTPLRGWNGVDVRTAPVDEQKRFATDYHDAMLSRYGNEPEALMAYNGGPGRIDKYDSGETTMADLPQETQDYPGKVMGDSAPSTGIMPAPTPPVNAPDHPSNYISELPHDHEANPWLSVAAGVLGTLAGRSRNPLVDIGQGGLVGLNNYAQQVKSADEQNYQEGSFHQNAQKLMQEADMEKQKFGEEQLHNSATEDVAQQNADTNEQYRKDQAANMLAERQKPIPDGFGGFIIPNPKDPANPIPINLGSSGGDASKPSIANIYNPPIGPDGNPLRGEDFLKTIPAPVAAQAKLYIKGDAPPPTGFASKPTLLAAQQAAAVADPTWTGQRYSTIQDFTKGPQTAKTVQAQNVTMEHIGTLQDAITALDNGDIRQFNKLSQEIARQTGSDVPTNFELGKTIVYDEVAKAILGANSAVSDRQEIVKNMDLGSSRKQAEGQLEEAGKYMAGQAYGLETRYTAGSGLTNYRDRFMTPAARQLMEKYYPSGGSPPEAKTQSSQPQPKQTATVIKYNASGNRIQ